MAVSYSHNLSTLESPVNYTLFVRLSGGVNYKNYVLQVHDRRNGAPLGTILADLRKPFNASDNGALFEISDILKTYATTDSVVGALDYKYTTMPIKSTSWDFEYSIVVGEETPLGAFDWSTNGTNISGTNFKSINGYADVYDYGFGQYNNDFTKYKTLWSDPLAPEVIEDSPGAFTVTDLGIPMTDLKLVKYNTLPEDRPGGQPYECLYTEVNRKDFYTLSLPNYYASTSDHIDTWSIASFLIQQYDAAGNLNYTYTINNTPANGGGPTSGGASTWPYNVLSIQCGPGNLPIILGTNTKWIKVSAKAWTNEARTTSDTGWHPLFLRLKDETCLDYDSVQLSWLNSYGVRDYYTFTKKVEKSVNSSRNTFDQSFLRYSEGNTINPAKGGSTIYSQKWDETWTLTTDWLTDEESELLEHLFKSASVRMQWPTEDPNTPTVFRPVIIQDSSYTVKTYRKDRLFQYEIKLKLAHNQQGQGGY